MTMTNFLILLSAFSVISSLFTEGVKHLFDDRKNFPYNITALSVALLIGGLGCAVYYQLNGLPFTVDNIIYMVLMGLASGLVSMTSYDKVKQAIEQITNQQK